jgi:hypothetical protein
MLIRLITIANFAIHMWMTVKQLRFIHANDGSCHIFFLFQPRFRCFVDSDWLTLSGGATIMGGLTNIKLVLIALLSVVTVELVTCFPSLRYGPQRQSLSNHADPCLPPADCGDTLYLTPLIRAGNLTGARQVHIHRNRAPLLMHNDCVLSRIGRTSGCVTWFYISIIIRFPNSQRYNFQQSILLVCQLSHFKSAM